KKRGAGLRILTESIVSPTLAAQLEELLVAKNLAEARWYQFEPVASDAPLEGARLAFGEPLNVVYDFASADVILALDADCLARGPAHVRPVRAFADRRRVRAAASSLEKATMNRLYVVEPSLTTTGAAADHRLAMKASRIGIFARAIASALKVPGAPD